MFYKLSTFERMGAGRLNLDAATEYRRNKPAMQVGEPPSFRVDSALRKFFSIESVRVPEQSAFDLRRARIVRSGITANTRDEIAIESIYHPVPTTRFGFEAKDGGLVHADDSPPPRQDGLFCNLMLSTESTYGHWLFELAPKIGAATRLGLADRKFVVSWRTPMRTHLEAVLAVHDIDPEKQIVLGRDHFTEYEQATFLPHQNHYPDWKSPRTTEFLEETGKRISQTKSRKRRLFITRDDAKDRQLLNIDDIWPVLQRQGFEKVTSGLLSFKDQIAAFQSAEMIVGVTGSALSNIVFSPSGTPVIFLSSNEMAGTWFYDICSQKDQPYGVIFGPTEHDAQHVHYRRNFTIDPRAVERAICTLAQKQARMSTAT